MRNRILSTRIAIAILLTFVMAEWSIYILRVHRELPPHRPAAYPFDLASPPAIGQIRDSAKRAGLRPGDRILLMNGRPVTGHGTLDRTIANAHAGDTMTLLIESPTGPRTVTLTLDLRNRQADAQITLAFQYFCLIVCIVPAFLVAFLRPLDHRAWILLALLNAFPHMFRFIYIPFFDATRFLNYALHLPAPAVWSMCMLLLGMHFPETFPWPRWLTRIMYSLAALVGTLGILTAVLQYAVRENMALYRALLPYVRFLQGPANLMAFLSVTWYFVSINRHLRNTKSPDTRRKLVLLNAGSTIAFLPACLATIRALILQKPVTQGLPPLLTVFIIGLMALFPLTLAYIVIVHRALDLRMVLRTGLKYALAQRGVRILQAFTTMGALLYAFSIAEHRTTTPQKLILVSSSFLFALLLQRLAQRLMAWVDRRFFRQAYNSEQLLSDLSDEVRTILDRDRLLETVCRRISESLHVPRIAFLLRNGQAYAPAFALGYHQTPAAQFAPNDPVATRLKQSKTPQTLYFDDPQSWVNRDLDSHPDRSSLASLDAQVLLPLELRDDLAGFVALGPKLSDEPYSRTDLSLLRGVAAQAGLALENSRLTATVAAEAAQRERLNRELEIARDVQHRLFPQKRPEIDGIQYAGMCRPALSVGGDYFDYMALSDGRLCLAVGDVSGKGIPAAILMAVLQTSVRGQAMVQNPDLSALIANVNFLVDESSAKGHFATLFYAQYNPALKRLRYVNAGHNPPFLIRADGSHELLKSTGVAIGWTKRAVFREAHTQLHPGDTVIFYTDGFTEAMNHARDEFGEDRLLAAALLCRALHPEAILPAILNTVDRFTEGAPQNDDMTMIALKVL
ncbi:MAG: SpoIIE family protein phosphatase [Bryobacterales bacterium]|nr:SpoIIE family protein phosphatase [Bryobacterales bacterium]